MTALRWTRRLLDAILLAAVLTVTVTAGVTLLAPVLGGRALVIGGGSMEPAIDRGALVLSLPAGAEGYAIGDVVTVQQGGSTPYTHRIVRLAELNGTPYVETKGDANPGPDPAIVPVAAIVGRIALSLPLLGYVSLALGTAMGLAGFLALCAMVLILVWVLEDAEVDRCPVCAAGATASAMAGTAMAGTATAGTAMAGAAAASHHGHAGTPAPAGILTALPAFALAGPPTHVRERGRARDPRTPVILEVDRRNPRRRALATTPDPATPDPATPGAAETAAPAGTTAPTGVRDGALAA
jgi:signal peptidase